ncbi:MULTISPECIES: phytanoyl-CoA dioxygenase family protein [Thalassospira]|uniref:Phytanoyl-CoA dioxygenase n=2 Tax=Thalassospira TaxID=168934 RepID=A0A367VZE1_9PROT|nr:MULTISPECIES: phytanoyl-CoA dioxygenase family protein [Thalassospira]MDG4720119.1 phytanoyl-CoA dioxygenase family protein [Thalassospira sp. FZY0004]RCK31762.1 hypothetical protein TH19_20290 [Thalassospira profundimaris]
MTYREDFIKNGYVTIKSAFSKSEYQHLRKTILSYDKGKRIIQPNNVISDQHLNKVLNNKQIKDALINIFQEEVLYYPNIHIQMNSFTQSAHHSMSGLHIDASSELTSRRCALTDTLPRWVNIGVYLQDWNNGGYGGGIMILPQTHKLIRFLCRWEWGAKLSNFIVRLLRRAPDFCGKTIPSNSGDVIIFDNRLMHASLLGKKAKAMLLPSHEPHQNKIDAIPEHYRKYAFYWFAGPQRWWEEVIEFNFYARVLSDDQVFSEDAFNYQTFKQAQHTQDWQQQIAKNASSERHD